jgi:hypothetical protein
MRLALALVATLFFAACGRTTLSSPDGSHEVAAGIEIVNPWAAPTPGGVDVSAGYLIVRNGGAEADTLNAVSSPRAASVEIHEMSMDGAIMRMRAVEGGLAIPAHGEVTLEPGGYHLMFMGVTQPFAEGEEIPVTLTFEHAGVIEVTLPVGAGAVHGDSHAGPSH